MSNKTFVERLERIENKSKTQPNKNYKNTNSSEILSKREKVLVSLRILESKGISTKYAFPPIFWGLHKIGIYPKPLHYKSSFSLFLMGFMLFICLFGAVLESGVGSDISRGPIAGLYRLGWGGIIISSILAGIAHVIFIRVKAKSCNVPRWFEIR